MKEFGCICWYIAMEIIAYAAVINANRAGVFEHVKTAMPTKRYRQKLDITVMAKSHRRKQKLFQTTQTATKLYTRLVWGAPLLSRRNLRRAVLLTLRTQIGRPERAQLLENDYMLYLQYHWTYLNHIWCVIYLYGQCMMCRRWLHLHMYFQGHGSLFWEEGVCDHENYSMPQNTCMSA